MFSVGCAGSVGYRATATVDTPDMVVVSPGVHVIADYDEPIFYSNGYYWWNTQGTWWRSSYYTSGWVEARPPTAIVSIGSPYRYRHYRPRGYTARYRPVPTHRIQRPYIRDRRARR